jgi:uncharacterized protein (TIGR03437 family)
VAAGITTPVPPQQVLLDTGGAQVQFAAATSGEPWVTLSPVSGVAPASLAIGVSNPGSLAAGTYRSVVFVTSTASNSPVRIPVTLTVTAVTSVSVAPISLVFNHDSTTGPITSQKTLTVSSSAPGVAFNVTALAFSGGNWLSVIPSSSLTPAGIGVNVNSTGMAAGNYTGTVSVIPVGNSAAAVVIPVTLNLTATSIATVSPAILTFQATPGSTPAAQSINVGSSGAPVAFTATANAPWVTIAPAAGTTPVNMTVSVNTSTLPQGVSSALITIVPAGTQTPVNVAVNVNVGAAAEPVLTGIVNAASFAPGPLAPGEIITIFGTNLGGIDAMPLRITDRNRLDTTLGETRVFIDDIAAPLLYVSAGQVSAIVPYEVYGRSTVRVQLERAGMRTAARDLRVVDAVPSIFVLDTTGQGAILNQDGGTNGPQNGADAGSVISIFATGEGQTTPAGVNGQLASLTLADLAHPLLPVTARIGGRDAEVLYAGSAPGVTAGALQVNVRIPTDAPRGAAVPVSINVGGFSSQPGVNVAIK